MRLVMCKLKKNMNELKTSKSQKMSHGLVTATVPRNASITVNISGIRQDYRPHSDLFAQVN